MIFFFAFSQLSCPNETLPAVYIKAFFLFLLGAVFFFGGGVGGGEGWLRM